MWVTFTNLTIDGVTLENGPIFYIGDYAQVTLGRGVSVRNIVARGLGSVFVFDGEGKVFFDSEDVVFKNYSSVPFSISHDKGFFVPTSTILKRSTLIDPGSMSIISPILASHILNSSLYKDYFPPTLKYTSNVPSNLIIANEMELTSASLLVESAIPDIVTKTTNFFGEILTFAQISNMVIIKLEEVGGAGAGLLGETLKGILDASSDQVVFSNVDFVGRKPGLYSIQARGVYNSITSLPGLENNWPTVNITIRDCDGQLTQFSSFTGTCLPLYKVNSAVRLGFTVFSVMFICLLILSLFALFHFRNFNSVRANSYTFLSSMTLGSILALLSITLGTDCMTSQWLKNLGFVVSVSSIIIKMYRLERIFKKTLQKRDASSLKDTQLLRYVVFCSIVIAGYLAVWTAVNPSTVSTVTDINAQSIYADLCSDSTFTYIAISTQFIVTVIAAYFAYNIRNIPDNFNETRLIGFACYNWVVFGTLLNLLVKGYIRNPTTSFALDAFSVLVPHLSSAFFLVFIRIYRCAFYPDASLKAKAPTFKSSIMPHISNATSEKPVVKSALHEEAEAKVTFDRKQNNRNPDHSLYTIGSNLALIIALMIIFLIFWSVTSPSQFEEANIDPYHRVISDQCSSSVFSSISIALRLLISLAIALTTYGRLKVSHTFPEIRIIILLCYNWLIFGGVLGLIAQFVINDHPETTFILSAISILFPVITGSASAIFAINSAIKRSKK